MVGLATQETEEPKFNSRRERKDWLLTQELRAIKPEEAMADKLRKLEEAKAAAHQEVRTDSKPWTPMTIDNLAKPKPIATESIVIQTKIVAAQEDLDDDVDDHIPHDQIVLTDIRATSVEPTVRVPQDTISDDEPKRKPPKPKAERDLDCRTTKRKVRSTYQETDTESKVGNQTVLCLVEPGSAKAPKIMAWSGLAYSLLGTVGVGLIWVGPRLWPSVQQFLQDNGNFLSQILCFVALSVVGLLLNIISGTVANIRNVRLPSLYWVSAISLILGLLTFGGAMALTVIRALA